MIVFLIIWLSCWHKLMNIWLYWQNNCDIVNTYTPPLRSLLLPVFCTVVFWCATWTTHIGTLQHWSLGSCTSLHVVGWFCQFTHLYIKNKYIVFVLKIALTTRLDLGRYYEFNYFPHKRVSEHYHLHVKDTLVYFDK